MLFVIVMEVLNSIIREPDRRGALSPLPGQAISHQASFYADDVVILVAPSRNDLNYVQQILQLFGGASRWSPILTNALQHQFAVLKK